MGHGTYTQKNSSPSGQRTHLHCEGKLRVHEGDRLLPNMVHATADTRARQKYLASIITYISPIYLYAILLLLLNLLDLPAAVNFPRKTDGLTRSVLGGHSSGIRSIFSLHFRSLSRSSAHSHSLPRVSLPFLSPFTERTEVRIYYTYHYTTCSLAFRSLTLQYRVGS